MLDPITAVSLIATIGTLLDYGSKVVSRLIEYQSSVHAIPQPIKGLVADLPLILAILQLISNNAKDGKLSDETCVTLRRVIDSCHKAIKAIDDIIATIKPISSDSVPRRAFKALQSVRQEEEITKLNKQLREHLSTLDTFVNASAVPQVVGTKERTIFSVPCEKDPDYVDRPDIMHQLHQALQTQNRVVLAGMGGVGKSQIAIEYCHRFRDEQPDSQVFWQHVSTQERAISGWSDIAKQLAIPGSDQPDIDVFHLVGKYLDNEAHGRWLLVLDNADDGDVFFKPPVSTQTRPTPPFKALVECLPHHKQGTIIVTTRDSRVGKTLASNKQIVTVPALAPEEALRLLQSKLPGQVWDANSAKQLLRELDCLPLAITQATAYISQESSSIGEYLEFFRSHEDRKDLLNMDFYDRRRDREIQVPVSRTWEISFSVIRRQRPRAIELLSIMVVMDREGIPKAILPRNGEKEISFKSTLAILQAFSLVSADTEGTTFRMHRLVQLSTQAWLEQEGKLEEMQAEALSSLAQAFPKASFRTWGQCRALEPHVQAISRYTYSSQSSKFKLSQLSRSLAKYEKGQGRYEDSHQRLMRALDLISDTLDSNDRATAEILAELGLLEESRGNYVQAEKMHRDAWILLKNAYGPNHRDTLQCLDFISGALYLQGKYEAAKQTQEGCWKLRKECLGNEHAQTLASLSNLAMCHEALGDLSVAITMQREAIASKLQTLGEDHPDTPEAISRLGCSLDKRGAYSEAESTHERAWELKKRCFGSDHPKTVKSREYMAGSLWYQCKYSDAMKIHEEILRTRIATLNEDHPLTLTTVKNIAFMWDCQGEHVKAEQLHRDALSGRSRVLGDEHPDTLQSMCDLAYSLHRQEKFIECEKLVLIVFSIRSRTLGEQHPQTIESMERISGILLAQKKNAAAIEMQQKALEARKAGLGPSHPNTLATMDDVVGSLWGEQRLEEATAILREALKLRKARYGEDDAETLIRMTRLAYLVRIQGRKDEAITLYQEAKNIYEKSLGPDDPNTQGCADNVADTLAEKLVEAKVGDTETNDIS